MEAQRSELDQMRCDNDEKFHAFKIEQEVSVQSFQEKIERVRCISWFGLFCVAFVIRKLV